MKLSTPAFAGKVQLETLLVSGRRGGLRVGRISLLMKKCASTLKVAGKIGISEFEEALSDGKIVSFIFSFGNGSDCGGLKLTSGGEGMKKKLETVSGGSK